MTHFIMPDWFCVSLTVAFVLFFVANFIALIGATEDNYFDNKENWRKLKNREITAEGTIRTNAYNERYTQGWIGDKRFAHFADGDFQLDGTMIKLWTAFSFGAILNFKYKSLRKEVLRKIQPSIMSSLQAKGTKADLEEYKSFL